MALTSTTTFDILGNTQILTFFNPSQVDQITYANNQITFAASTGYTLSKTDLLLYFQYLIVFNNLLNFNFPNISQSINSPWPLCQFDISETNVGVKKIIYTQNTNSTNVITINYLPIASSGAFLTRASPVTITLQEYISMIDYMTLYKIQVNLN